MQTNAGLAAKRSQLCAKMSRMLANCDASIVAGTPGAYDLSQGMSMVLLSSTIVAITSSLGRLVARVYRAARAPARAYTGSRHDKTFEETGMAKTRSGKRPEAAENAAQGVRDSAQKIWLAGLGAFERAKSEGPRMFDTLVEQGRAMGARAAGAADEALKSMREAGNAGGRWDKLEQVFEDRVSRSLNRLGVLTTREV